MKRLVNPKMDGPTMPINHLFDTKKLRKFQNNQHRHTIMRSIRPYYKPQGKQLAMSVQERLRQGPAEYFNVYTRTVIPQIEARIEERLLSEYMRSIPNELERQELFNAYNLRRHRLSKMPEEADLMNTGLERKPLGRKVSHSEIMKSITSIDGSGIRYHNYSDIGTFTVFPAQYRHRLFPTKCYGRID